MSIPDAAFAPMERFNSNVRGLMQIAETIDGANPTVGRVRNLVSIGTDLHPFEAIKLAGPYITKYAEQIKNKDANFFLTGGIAAEIATANEMVAEVFGLVSTRWPQLSADQQAKIWLKVENMRAAAERFAPFAARVQ